MTDLRASAPMLRSPLTWLPVLLSGAALALIAGYMIVVGPVPQAGGDEGAAARIFQLLIALDVLAIVAFAARWLPHRPRAAGAVVALQVLAAAVPLLAIATLESR